MAFPQVSDADTTNGVVTSNSTTWTITYCGNIVAGDLLLCFVATDGASAPSAASGWTFVVEGQSAGSSGFVLGRNASGSESGTFVLTISASEQGAWRMFRLPAASWYGGTIPGTGGASADGDGISAVVDSTGSPTSTPDPGARNPANWGIEDTLWFASAAVDTSRTFSGFPASYTNTSSDVSGGATGASLGLGRRENAVASEDPGTFTISASDDWLAITLAVRPAVAAAARVPRFTSYPQLLAH